MGGWRVDGREALFLGDILGRAGIVCYFTYAAASTAHNAFAAVAAWSSLQVAHKPLWLLSQLAVLLFLLLVVATTIVRLKPVRSAEGLEPRISALAGTFILGLLALMPPAQQVPPAVVVLALVMTVVGFALSSWVLYWLGRSFSIMAEARRLVIAGPYAVVRHPLYVTEEIAIIGIIILNLSPQAVLLGLAHWALQLRRMHNEERVLRATFPEYDSYAATTPKVLPLTLPSARRQTA